MVGNDSKQPERAMNDGTKGAAFRIYKRDFSVATGEDKVDKSALPKAMQVRKDKFGKVGQTKWTHLSAEDTTYAGRDKGEFNAWADKNNPNLRKLEKKRAGMKGFEVKKHLE